VRRWRKTLDFKEPLFVCGRTIDKEKENSHEGKDECEGRRGRQFHPDPPS
jgi:hypothetical protein